MEKSHSQLNLKWTFTKRRSTAAGTRNTTGKVFKVDSRINFRSGNFRVLRSEEQGRSTLKNSHALSSPKEEMKKQKKKWRKTRPVIHVWRKVTKKRKEGEKGKNTNNEGEWDLNSKKETEGKTCKKREKKREKIKRALFKKKRNVISAHVEKDIYWTLDAKYIFVMPTPRVTK